MNNSDASFGISTAIEHVAAAGIDLPRTRIKAIIKQSVVPSGKGYFNVPTSGLMQNVPQSRDTAEISYLLFKQTEIDKLIKQLKAMKLNKLKAFGKAALESEKQSAEMERKRGDRLFIQQMRERHAKEREHRDIIAGSRSVKKNDVKKPAARKMPNVKEIEIPLDYWMQWATPGLPERSFVTKINMGETFASSRKPKPGQVMLALPKGVKVKAVIYLREVKTGEFDDSEVEVEIGPYKVKTPAALQHFGIKSPTINIDIIEWFFTTDWETDTISLYQYDSRGDEIIVPVKKTGGYFKSNKANSGKHLSIRYDVKSSHRYVLTEIEGRGRKHKSVIDLCTIPLHLAFTTSSIGLDTPSPKTAWLAGRKVKFFYYHDGSLVAVQEVFD